MLVPGCRQTAKQEDKPVETITTKTGVQMVLIPAGDFVMGDDTGDADERPAHAVHVSAFYMDRCEVTQKSYESLMGVNPSRFKADRGPDKAADRPVERVCWVDAIAYCNMRSAREGLTPCYIAAGAGWAVDFNADGYRLPTEAEWEYACRAGPATGSRTAYGCGDDVAALRDAAWFHANCGQSTHAVGQKRPNAWGLFDMHGNVAEWCHDVYAEDYGRASEAAPGRGPGGPTSLPASGEKRVMRGGSWRSGEDRCRSAARTAESPRLADTCFGYDAFGFRCVRKAP